MSDVLHAGYEAASGGGGFRFPDTGTSIIASSDVVLVSVEVTPIAT